MTKDDTIKALAEIELLIEEAVQWADQEIENGGNAVAARLFVFALKCRSIKYATRRCLDIIGGWNEHRKEP